MRLTGHRFTDNPIKVHKMNLQKQLQVLCSFTLLAAIALPAFAEEKVAATTKIKASDLNLDVPKEWKQQQPSNNLRLAQFLVPAKKEGAKPAELVISGPFGGTASQNIQRWFGQFQSEGRTAKMTQGKTEQGKYVLVDMTGTYNRSVGPPFQRKTEAVPNFRVVNVMLTVTAGRGGNYFLKLTGPKETVEYAIKQFRASFSADAEKEEPFEL